MVASRHAILGKASFWLALTAIAFLLTSSHAMAAPPASGYTITDLGAFYPTGINNKGQVTGTQTAGNVSQAVIWNQGTITPLPFLPGGHSSSAAAISNLPSNATSAAPGEVVGQAADGAGHEVGTYWLNGGTPAARGGRSCYSVNDAGDIAGQVFESDFAGNLFIYAIVWKASGTIVKPLGDGTDGVISGAEAINNNGDIAGFFNPGVGSSSYGFLQTSTGQNYDLRLTGDTRAIARAVNDNQVTVGESSHTGSIRGFVFTPNPQTVTALPPLAGGMNTSAYSVNKIGDIVGYAQRNDASTGNVLVSHAAKWVQLDANTLVTVDLNDLLPAGSGWSNLSISTGINDNGEIIGSGTHNGQTEAFLLTPPLHGIDVSVQPNYQNVIDYYNTNFGLSTDFVMADAWGGKSAKPAQGILATAPSDFRKAAYCLLNFNNKAPYSNQGGPISYADGWVANQTGAWQVRQALQAVGTELPNIKFMAIDVEYPGNGNPGGGIPLAGVSPLQRIAEAVQEVLNHHIKPVFYTRDNNGDWSAYTGGATAFSQFPLIDVSQTFIDKKKALLDDSLLQDAGENWEPFGGWLHRDGRQYVLDDSSSGSTVDRDVMAPSLFDDPFTHPLPASDVTNLVIFGPLGAPAFSHGAGPITVRYSITITNNSSQAIPGPLDIAFPNLPNGVAILNPSDTHNGVAYICWQTIDGLLQPEASVTIPVVLAVPSHAIPTLTETVYSGYF